MWLFVMFDLPVGTQQERKQASDFRHQLQDAGFEMSQFSIYLKYFATTEKAEATRAKVRSQLPPGGKVDILMITDKQFSNMERFYAKSQIKNQPKPDQLHLF